MYTAFHEGYEKGLENGRLEANYLRGILKELDRDMASSINRCCGKVSGHQFCESYGCGTLQGYRDVIKCALMEPNESLGVTHDPILRHRPIQHG